MKKFFITIPKVLFAIMCYLCTLLLSILSGYFTIVFYSQSQSVWNVWAMGGLAGMLEFIKIMLAVSFPFIQYRDIKREKKVSFYLKICFFLSIMASMYFFMSGGEIERSPASNIVSLLYTYIPLLNIIPLQFAQFISTMSLSILVEAFIIFLPILAPVLFIEKDKENFKRRSMAENNIEKIKEIITAIPERLIDNLHQKVVGVKADENDDIKIIEMNKDNTLLDNKINKPFVQANTSNNKLTYTKVSENKEPYEFVKANNEEIEIVKKAINEYQINGISPSIPKLIEITGLQKSTIQSAKKELSNKGFIKTDGNKTFIIDEDQLN
jgi:hypothetical protein